MLRHRDDTAVIELDLKAATVVGDVRRYECTAVRFWQWEGAEPIAKMLEPVVKELFGQHQEDIHGLPLFSKDALQSQVAGALTGKKFDVAVKAIENGYSFTFHVYGEGYDTRGRYIEVHYTCEDFSASTLRFEQTFIETRTPGTEYYYRNEEQTKKDAKLFEGKTTLFVESSQPHGHQLAAGTGSATDAYFAGLQQRKES
jgi:hypothetical protein